MDLNTIIMHLDNFVDTWKGWGQVFHGLFTLSSERTVPERPEYGDTFVDAWNTAKLFSSASSDNQ